MNFLVPRNSTKPKRRRNHNALRSPGEGSQMKYLGWVLVLFAAMALALPMTVPAQSPCKDGLTGRVQANYQSLRGFKGRFTQEDRRSDGGVLKAEGEIAYLKPGRMRWAYDPPEEQLLITDGKTVWLHDPLLDNVTVQPLAGLTQGTPLAFLLGAGNLESDFTCRPFTLSPPSDGLAYVELVPRAPIPALAFIQLGAHPKTSLIAALVMVDTQGNQRRVRFSDLILDPPLSEKIFTFEITPDMEVIEK